MTGMRVLPDAVTTAAALGVPLLVLTSGAHRVDAGKVAALVEVNGGQAAEVG